MTMGPVYPHFTNSNETDMLAYDNQTLLPGFNISCYPWLSCTPNLLEKFRVYVLDPMGPDVQRFTVPLYIYNLEDTSIHLKGFNTTQYYEYQDIIVSPASDIPPMLEAGGILKIDLVHKCNRKSENSNYWSIIDVYLKFSTFQSITLQYQFICDPDYHPSRFDWSNIILVTCVSLLIWQLAKFGRIYSFQIIFKNKMLQQSTDLSTTHHMDPPFQGFRLYWPQAVGYVSLFILATYLSLILQEKAEEVLHVIVHIYCSLCAIHLMDELLCLLRRKLPVIKKKLFILRVCDYLAVALAFVLMFCYIFFEQPWFVSDMLTICILGSMIKLFKINSLKNSLQFFLIIMAVDIGASIYVGITVRYEWDSLVLKFFNTPLCAQIPYFRNIYKKKCGWVSVFSVMFPGFFLGYVHRFDRCKQTFVYEIISFMGLLVGLILWLIVQYAISFPLPTSIFTEVLMVGICAIVAYARNEMTVFWSGLFYDEILVDPFKNEVDYSQLYVVDFFGIGVSKRMPKPMEPVKHQQLVQQSESGGVQLNSIMFRGMQATDTVQQIPPPQYQNPQQQQIQQPSGVHASPANAAYQSNLNYFKEQERKNGYQKPK